ncbi:hypothetical protein INR49_005667 [Caranx melampygus]|nr:hypothetical protein INR49_005667 [Caranx melampygus]
MDQGEAHIKCRGPVEELHLVSCELPGDVTSGRLVGFHCRQVPLHDACSEGKEGRREGRKAGRKAIDLLLLFAAHGCSCKLYPLEVHFNIVFPLGHRRCPQVSGEQDGSLRWSLKSVGTQWGCWSSDADTSTVCSGLREASSGRLTDRSRQLAFRKGAAVFIVNERPKQNSEELLGITDRYSQRVNVGKYKRDNSASCLYDVSPHYPVDTVSNVCFEVEDVERSFKALRHLGCNFLVPPTTVEDEDGLVTYSVVKSIVGNVCHTLIDTTKYKGDFLPGFDVEKNCSLQEEDMCCPITHFDHITYACPRKTTHQLMRWYEQLFGFQRFFIDRQEPGRHLLAGAQGPGIQHIGLYTKDIVSTAHTMAGAGVLFFSPPPAYYTEVCLTL